VLISSITAHALWFWGLRRPSASSVTFLSLLNPVVAAMLGWAALGQRLKAW
jgi:probable blue pigment (indigoidine) exporter